jgi:hypothetical protein
VQDQSNGRNRTRTDGIPELETEIRDWDGAECGALEAGFIESLRADPRLAQIVQGWVDLSDTQRNQIIRIAL